MKRIAILCSITVALSYAATVFAHGITFFEFAPDTEKYLNVSQVQAPSQPFYPPNDFMDGFDVWFANIGAPGNVTFDLRDDQNALLASRTVTAPTANHRYSGTKLHVDFSSLVPVTSTKLYKVRIVTLLPSFYLYYADQFQILQHNASLNPYYSVEPAFLGSIPQNFAFRFALAESTETVPPVLTNATTTILNPYAVRFAFYANEPVDYRAELVPAGAGSVVSTAYLGNYTACLPGGNFCSHTISVAPGTSYQYTLFAKDVWGNLASITGSVTTPADPNAPPPPPGGGGPPPPPPGGDPPPPPPAGGPPPPPDGNPPPPDGTPPPHPGSGDPPPPGGTSPGTGGGNQPPPAPAEPPPGGASIQVSAGGPNSSEITVTWTPPADMRGVTGYRIQIRNEKNELIQEITASAESRKLVVERLGPGKYLITVYVERNGVLEQLGESIPFAVGGIQVSIFFGSRKLYFVGLIVILGIGILAWVINRIRVKRTLSVPAERSKSIFDKITDTSNK